MCLPHPHFVTKPCVHLVCCGGQCPDPHHWCRFSHTFPSSHQLLARPTVQRIMFLSAYSHVMHSSIPSVKLIQQPSQHMDRFGPVLAVHTTSQAMFIHTHTSKTCHMYFCTKMHYAVPWIPLTVAHTKLVHAWTKPPNSPCMAVYHCIGYWTKVSLYAAADHETVTIRPPPA